MCNYFPKRGNRTKKQNILLIIILVLVAGLFFLVFLSNKTLAKNDIFVKNSSEKTLSPMEKISQDIIFGDIFSLEKKQKKLDETIYNDLVRGYPMEEMVTEISKKDKIVAAFLISIAKKESNWGIHTPKKDGRECFNYWGYRGRENATDSGYSCFDSPEHAVAVVGRRIERLVEQKIDTPEKMIIWKCGSDCSWDNPNAVRKWIADVDLYYHKINS